MKKYTALLVMDVLLVCTPLSHIEASYRFSNFTGRPPIHTFGSAAVSPAGLVPNMVRKQYNLPSHGGSGTIALIEAYDDAVIEHDLGVFSKEFGLAPCTENTGCFEKHAVGSAKIAKANVGWSLETSLDVEWAHAIAPNAKILLVEAPTPSGANFIRAIDYARRRSDVVAISMSWGGREFPEEVQMENHFKSKNGAVFFASSGDNGYGVSWPAVSANVVSVGGTTLHFTTGNAVASETAWEGSGGGVSAYISIPDFQKTYVIPRSQGARAVPDVAFNADPASGYSVYDSLNHSILKSWFVVGGTSAGAPQWAAIQALGHTATNDQLYTDKAAEGNAIFFRDIISGRNGDCGYYCTARMHYDYVTGLGSPLQFKF